MHVCTSFILDHSWLKLDGTRRKPSSLAEGLLADTGNKPSAIIKNTLSGYILCFKNTKKQTQKQARQINLKHKFPVEEQNLGC